MNAHRILVIDDDPTHLACTKELLEAEGYEVHVHHTAFGATEKVMHHSPDLVLLDVNMPALSGEGLASLLRARERTSRVPILLHSSNDEHALRDAARRLGLEGWVAKGDVAELRRKVRATLCGRGGATPAGGPLRRPF